MLSAERRAPVHEVDLVLAGVHLVVAGLDLEAHLLQAQADLPAGGLPVVQGAQVEVPGLVAGAGGGAAVLISLEQEELQLRPGVEGEAHVLRLPQRPLQHASGVSHEGRAVGIVDVADQPGHLAVLGPPGQHREGVQVRPQVLVGLLHPDEALDGTAVHHDLPVQSPPDLRGGDGHVFQLAEDVGELHADELDVLLPDQAEDVSRGTPRLDLFHRPRNRSIYRFKSGILQKQKRAQRTLRGPLLSMGGIIPS